MLIRIVVLVLSLLVFGGSACQPPIPASEKGVISEKSIVGGETSSQEALKEAVVLEVASEKHIEPVLQDAASPEIHEEPTNPELPSTTEQVPEETGLKVDLYDPKLLLKIDIRLPKADWDELRIQYRDYSGFLAPKCFEKPFESAFTYKKAVVTINGKTLKDVGIRKKGFVGSIDEIKPSLKLKFDKFVKKQKPYGIERMTLNNNKSDLSIIRQCLVYGLFARAGIPAPRCNFAHVTINGVDFGIFTHVESMKKKFLKHNYGESEGRFYEGTLSDFRPRWVGTFEPKTDETNPDRSDLQAVVDALKLPNDKLLPALSKVVDIDKFIKFWAMEMLTNHWDGYTGNTNNFYVYNNPKTKKFEFLPWGVDGVLRSTTRVRKGAPSNLYVNGYLARRLYLLPATRAKYIAQLKSLLQTFWKEGEVIKEIDRMEKLVAPFAAKGHFQKNAAYTLQQYITQLRGIVRKRRSDLKPVLDNPPEYYLPPSDQPCFKLTSNTSGSISTTYGSLGAKNPFIEGKGSLKGNITGKNATFTQVGVTAGDHAKEKAWLQIQQTISLGGTRYLIVTIAIEKRHFVKGTPIRLKGLLDRGRSHMSVYDIKTRKSTLLGLLWKGSMLLSQASRNKGDKVEGSFSAEWVDYSGDSDPVATCFNACLKAGAKHDACGKKATSFRNCVLGGKTTTVCWPLHCGKP